MLEKLKPFEPILMLVLGWAMGLLAVPITERIRRRYRKRDLMQAVLEELFGLQYTMALVAYRIRARSAEITDEFLDSILPIVEKYAGPDSQPRIVDGIKNLRKQPEKDRIAQHLAVKNPNAGILLKQYALPLLGAQIADLAICALPFQRTVLNIRYQLDLFNQSVPYLQTLFDKTFTVTDAQNRQTLINNMEEGYRDLARRAETMVKAIDDLRRHSTR